MTAKDVVGDYHPAITLMELEEKVPDKLSREEFERMEKKLLPHSNIKWIKGKDFYVPIRVAITGMIHGPELLRVIPVLGSQRCLIRIRNALGGGGRE